MTITKNNKEGKVISEKMPDPNDKTFTEQSSQEALNQSINIYEMAKCFIEGPSESRNFVLKIPPELHCMGGLPIGFPIGILDEIPPDENGVTVISMEHPKVRQFIEEHGYGLNQ